MELHLLVIALILTVIISYPFMFSAGRRGAYRQKSDIIIEDAKKNGRMAVARLVSQRFMPGDPGHKNPLDRDDRWLGTYAYEVNGKQYTCGASTTESLPETLTVYYPAGQPEKGITVMTTLVGTKPVLAVMTPVILMLIIYRILEFLA